MAEAVTNDDDASRRRKRGLLKMYYGSGQQEEKKNPYDINEAYFQHDAYLEKLFKEKTLHELMDKESEIIKQIRSLDSDMQTLVYENYNKFINATDIIKKMKNDFRKMEDEMNKLDTTLSSVTEFSDKVNNALHEKRSHIAQLSGVHTLLHKLQFLFELPNRLKKCIELKQFALAVRYYIKARGVLNKYKHMPSFQGIHSDCEAIVIDLMQHLRDQLRNPTISNKIDKVKYSYQLTPIWNVRLGYSEQRMY